MFYRNAGRSTVLDRIESHRTQPPDAADVATAIDAALLDARRQTEQQPKAKLSAFEKELLMAWSQD
jgi:hypothetical protein